jgi:hypothetical protein
VDRTIARRGIRRPAREQSEVVLKPVDLGRTEARRAVEATDADLSEDVNRVAFYVLRLCAER